MADKLGVYNGALQTYLDTRPLASLTDSRVERRALDKVWDATMKYMLYEGFWNFAIRSQEWAPSSTVTPQFGFQYAYEKEDDFVRLVSISDNEDLRPTLEFFEEEGDFIYADCSQLWVRFTSSDASYGYDLGKWTPAFTAAFEAELAWRARGGVKTMSADAVTTLEKIKRRRLLDAKAKDAAGQAAAILPTGRLVRSRGGLGHTNRMRRTPYA